MGKNEFKQQNQIDIAAFKRLIHLFSDEIEWMLNLIDIFFQKIRDAWVNEV